MAIVEFSKIELPPLDDKLTPSRTRRLLNNIMALMLFQRLEVFNNEGGRSKWAPLTKKYAAWKLRRYGGKSSKILSLSNALRQSFTATGGQNKPSGNGEAIITEDSATLQTHVEYAAAQNFGSTHIIPARGKVEVHVKVFNERSGREGQHRFASKKEVAKFLEKGSKNFTIHARDMTYGSHIVTIPKRPFDEFRDKDTAEIQELT